MIVVISRISVLKFPVIHKVCFQPPHDWPTVLHNARPHLHGPGTGVHLRCPCFPIICDPFVYRVRGHSIDFRGNAGGKNAGFIRKWSLIGASGKNSPHHFTTRQQQVNTDMISRAVEQIKASLSFGSMD